MSANLAQQGSKICLSCSTVRQFCASTVQGNRFLPSQLYRSSGLILLTTSLARRIQYCSPKYTIVSPYLKTRNKITKRNGRHMFRIFMQNGHSWHQLVMQARGPDTWACLSLRGAFSPPKDPIHPHHPEGELAINHSCSWHYHFDNVTLAYDKICAYQLIRAVIVTLSEIMQKIFCLLTDLKWFIFIEFIMWLFLIGMSTSHWHHFRKIGGN
jgi:hypothetical protein